MGAPPKVQPNNILLAVTKRLGYTVLMDVPPKVQLNIIVLALSKDWVILLSRVSHLKYSLILTNG